jgi:hypothetical protein
MSAVIKTVQKTLFQQQLEAVMYYGAPGAHLEANEVPQDIDEQGDHVVSEFVQAMSEFDKDEKQFDRLLRALMCDMTADQLIEFRDLCRARFLDYRVKVQQRLIDREMGLL